MAMLKLRPFFALRGAYTRCSARAAIALIAQATLLTAAPTIASAQSLAANSQRATRTELAKELSNLEQRLSDQRTKPGDRAKLQEGADAIRNRLKIGDFRVGDRFLITVRTDSVRSDTASVRDSLKVAVLNLPDISLSGVLRSELDERMSAHVARFLRNASARTNVLTRIAVLGAVRTPGYYYASPDRPVSDVVMLAGGPAEQANLKQLEVNRGGKTIVRAKDSDRLIKDGKTLEQVDIQSGDEIRVPVKRKVNWSSIIQLFFVISSLFFAALQFVMWYYNRKDS